MKGVAIITVMAAMAVPASAGAAAGAPANAAATRQYEGTIVSVNRDRRTFRLRDSECGTVRIKVTRGTRFERLSGFSGLRAGMTRIEATVARSGRRWAASEVERSGGGGRHGGHGGHGRDD